MKRIDATVTSKGRVTNPKEVREWLQLSTRDNVTFVLEDDGTVRIATARYPTIASLRGAAGSLDLSLFWGETRRIAREGRYASP